MTVKPEFPPLSFCLAGPPFGFRLVITVGSGRDSFLLRRLLFNFTDLNGGFSVLTVTPISTRNRIDTRFHAGPPSDLAVDSNAELVADPHSRFHDADDPRIAAGASRTQSAFVQFGCGVPPGGTLVVIVDGTDRAAGCQGSVRVRVGD